VNTQLVEDGTDVCTAGVHADLEIPGDDLGGLPLSEEIENLALMRCEFGYLGTGG
jgi:hypothetical protein